MRETSTAPTTTRRGRTGYASMNSWRPDTSIVRDTPCARASRAASTRAASAAASPSEPSSSPSSWTTRTSAGSAPVPGGWAPNDAGGASAGSGVTIARPSPRPSRVSLAAVTATSGTRGRDQHVDGPAAGEPHVPRLLVADPVADDALAAALARRPDLLGRGPLDAAPGHGAREPPVVGDEQDRTLGPRRRAERPHHDGAADARALRAPPVQRVQQLLHRDLRFVGRAFADQPRRRRARGCRSRPARSIM